MNQEWTPVIGDFSFMGGEITFTPQTTTSSGRIAPMKHGYLKYNRFFKHGRIRFRVKLSSSQARVAVVFNYRNGTEIFAGINVNGLRYGVARTKGHTWDTLSVPVSEGCTPFETWINLDIVLEEDTIEISVNKDKVAKAPVDIRGSQIALYVMDSSPVIIRDLSVKTASIRACALLAHESGDESLYRNVIKPACEQYGIDLFRTCLEEFPKGSIDSLRHLLEESTLVIVDATKDLAGMAYGLGFAHGSGAATILLGNEKPDILEKYGYTVKIDESNKKNAERLGQCIEKIL